MNKIKKAYYYLFYRLYKYYESGPFIWWSDWKAVLFIDMLWIFIGISLVVYYEIFIDRYLHIGNGELLLIGYVLLISLPNYFIFHHRDQWREIVTQFDMMPKKKHTIYGIIVLFFILLIISNMVFAFYLMSQIDWSQYR
jgi:hypothetical protein